MPGDQLNLNLPMSDGRSLTVAGLFAGIGGIEKGLHQEGHRSQLLCEIEPTALAVLRKRFPNVPEIVEDVRKIKHLPDVDLVVAGFPCQDLSQAGRTAGISGSQSGLVEEVFRLVSGRKGPTWLMLENVPFMLQLERGRAMNFLTATLDRMGYRWAYRVVDTRSFGLPQRRKRVILLASRSEDPRPVLFADDSPANEQEDDGRMSCGFYWTEGLRGLGWAIGAVPTLKGGSTVGIPSPPAIWKRATQSFITPDIRDAERLQGFPVNWTQPAITTSGQRSDGVRWKLVGNAVSVPLAQWVGRRLRKPGSYDRSKDEELDRSRPWPSAAWGREGRHQKVAVTQWPVASEQARLDDFLMYDGKPLSERAAKGFRKRTQRARLRFPPGFLEAMDSYIASFEMPAP